MSNRYLILSRQRSGSNKLESGIVKQLNSDGNTVLRLGELYNRDMAYTGTKIALNDPSRIRYRDDIYNSVENDISVGMTLRIFPEGWISDHFLLIDKINYFLNHGFKLIVLERSTTECAISRVTAGQTNHWHTFGKFNDVHVQTKLSKAELHNSYEYFKSQQTYIEYIKTKLPHIIVNYATMESDCLFNDVPFTNDISTLTTYDRPYSEIISNWDEVCYMIKLLEEIYGR